MIRFHRRAAIFLTASSLGLAACSPEADAPSTNNDDVVNVAANDAMVKDAQQAQPIGFIGADGKALGTVSLSSDGNGSTIAIEATGIPAGIHGIHLHEKGLCAGPKFETAGGHWNPAKKQHGRDNPQGAHLGDLANLEVGGDGSVATSFTVAGATAAALADADGTALVVHAKADDYMTDPSGDSGDRIACAVIAAPR